MHYGTSAPASSTIILFIVPVVEAIIVNDCERLSEMSSVVYVKKLSVWLHLNVVDLWGFGDFLPWRFVIALIFFWLSEPGSFRIWTFKVKWRLWALVSAAMCCRNNFFDRHITLCPCVLKINLLNELLPAQWPRLISWTAPGSLQCFAIVFWLLFFSILIYGGLLSVN